MTLIYPGENFMALLTISNELALAEAGNSAPTMYVKRISLVIREMLNECVHTRHVTRHSTHKQLCK